MNWFVLQVPLTNCCAGAVATARTRNKITLTLFIAAPDNSRFEFLNRMKFRKTHSVRNRDCWLARGHREDNERGKRNHDQSADRNWNPDRACEQPAPPRFGRP